MDVVECLLASGRDRSTPAACVEQGTTPQQRVVRAPLHALNEAVERQKLASPAVVVVGEVAAYAMEGKLGGLGLEGRRVLVTRSDLGIDDTLQALLALGAVPILMPLIRIDYEVAEKAQLEAPLKHDWIVFTSVHGVYGFWRVLHRAGVDSRALSGCKVAAVGSATARALRNQGIAADLIPPEQTSAGLAQALPRAAMPKGCRVIHPRGDITCVDMTERLRGAGVHVEEMIVYSTVDATPSQASLMELEKGVDAILFFSPSAVRRFSNLGLRANGAAIACIGPTTAKAAVDAGLPADIVPATRTGEALVSRLAEHFTQPKGRSAP
jgi:uroporphyrinogen III methyltransferase/synthase